MTSASPLRESLVAVVLVGLRLWFHRDPFDWIVILGVCWALLPLRDDPRYRNAVLGFGVTALATLYLKAQVIHMLATSKLLP